MKVARLLCDQGASLGYDEGTASGMLCEFARVGELEKIKLLIECGATIDSADYDGRTCFHLAASVSNLSVVQCLIERGVDLNFTDRWGGTALADAVREGHRQCASAIRAAGGQLLFDEGKSSGELCEMARCGDTEGIKLLLFGGCLIDAADYDKRTCIHLAASTGNLLVVEELLKQGADFNVKDRWGGIR
jgi:potassium channel